MTDSNKKGPDDWDSAIDEWDKAFTPEVATDKETKKVATLSVIPMIPGDAARPTAAEGAPAADAPKPPPPPGMPAVPAAAAAPIPILNAPHVASRVPRPVSFVPRPMSKSETKSEPKLAVKPAAPSPPAIVVKGLEKAARPAPPPSAPTPTEPLEDPELPESDLNSDVDLEAVPSSAAVTPAGLPDDVDALLGVSDDSKTFAHTRAGVSGLTDATKTVVHTRAEIEAAGLLGAPRDEAAETGSGSATKSAEQSAQSASESGSRRGGPPTLDLETDDVELVEARDSGPPAAPASPPRAEAAPALVNELEPVPSEAPPPAAARRPTSQPTASQLPPRPLSSRPPPPLPSTRAAIPLAPPTTPGFRTDEVIAALPSGDLMDPDESAELAKPSGRPRADSDKVTLDPPGLPLLNPEFGHRGDFADIPTQEFAQPEIARAAAAGRVRGFIAEEAREAFAERAAWLEAEARAAEDPAKTARGLLAVSELKALLGDDAGALEAAVAAAQASPELVLAHKQARGLGPTDDIDPLVAALDHEVATLDVPAARTHAALFAADLLRLRGDEAAAAVRWELAARSGDADVRIAFVRAAHALAAGQLDRAAAVRASPGATVIAKALGDLLRVRGHEAGSEGIDLEGPLAVNDALRRTRAALDAGDVGAAVGSLIEVGKLPELAPAARWVAASLAQTRSATRAGAGRLWSELSQTDPLAVRSLAGCAVELGDPALLEGVLDNAAFSIADRATLATLLDVGAAGSHPSPRARALVDDTLATLAGSDALAPLASAIAGTCRASLPADDDPARGEQVELRASRVAGNPASRDALRLGRLIATAASPKVVEAAAAASPGAVEARAVALEMAARAKRFGDVSDAIKGWTSAAPEGDAGKNEGAAQALLAAALVAERGQDLPRALSAYREARAADPTNETLLRIVAALDPSVEPPGELNQLADDLGEGLQGALARLEAVVREHEVDDRTRSDLLERAHRAAPDSVLPQLMAEQLARKSGDVEEVLRWIRERRATSSDALEQALDAVREALLVADTQPQIAADRLEEALRTRPSDAALRELYERLAPEPPADRAAWREQRAAVSTGDARALYYMEAAHEYERMGDHAQALKAAIAAVESGDSVLARIARERAEVEASEPARLADELLTLARSTENPRERREAYERLADLDATARSDTSSALLWHRSILEEVHDYKPSLRHVEQALLSEGRDDELEPIATSVAKALSGAAGGEAGAHAALAARLRARGAAGDVDSTFDLAELAAGQPDPPLAALRLIYAHARARKDDALILKTTMALVERATRPLETSALLVRAAESALRLNDLPRADELLTRAKAEDPADMVTWRLIADVKVKTGKNAEAAEAYESLARTSAVASHQLAAWYDAAVLWQGSEGEASDEDRAVQALEQASTLDVTYKDVFSRLLALYTKRGAGGELATLLERRVATITDPAERVAMEVERGRALLGVQDLGGAREALQAALAADPDHTQALATYGDLCAKQGDWEPAEQAWVRLARLLTSPDEQRDIYARLGELYSSHAVNLTRAETAWKEVLKRAPGDVPTLDRLIDIHRRQGDAARAGEIVQQLAVQSKDPAERRRRLIELSQIHENPGKDLRKAEQVLEGARREAPTDVTVLRALAEFYLRHKQMPAVQILLDRAAADARRAFAAGRFAPALFEVMRAVFDLRGKKDAANVVSASLAALEGTPAPLRGGELRALDPRLDDLLAPELISPSLRSLLAQCGDALDAATPFDARAAQAAPMQTGPLFQIIQQFAQSTGLPQVQVLVSPKLPRTCVALGSAPPLLVVGESLAQTTSDRARAFLVVRAIKLVLVHASALVRAPATDVVVLVSAWLQAFNPTWVPEGVNAPSLAAAAKRVAAGMPRDVPADAGVMALEIAGGLGAQMATLGASTLAWANRAALLAVGDPNAALDAVAWTMGKECAPTDPKERGSWVVRTREASDLLAFSVSDAYAEARGRLGLDR